VVSETSEPNLRSSVRSRGKTLTRVTTTRFFQGEKSHRPKVGTCCLIDTRKTKEKVEKGKDIGDVRLPDLRNNIIKGKGGKIHD